MAGSCLDSATIRHLVLAHPPLLEGYLSLDEQLQPNGFDLTVGQVAAFTAPGQIGAENAQRRLAGTTPLSFSSDGFLDLSPGPYLLTFNEAVGLPRDLMAVAKPRSSLLRSGVAVHNAVWDAGYHGRSQALLVVYHPLGFRLARNARVVQMVFFRLEREAERGYQGQFQRENL
ncbi:MAG: deoxyuridine 5'-triphosphate nucleotidohydrolase [Chloroflexi bacterium]|nr:deoxyuridine 5'-triphosphate nucleotidohydrolase [Chloroflexota bacterium]